MGFWASLFSSDEETNSRSEEQKVIDLDSSTGSVERPHPNEAPAILEEYKQLWSDLLQTRSQIRKTFVYVSSVAAVFVGLLRFVEPSPEVGVLQYSSVLASIIFSIIGLNYVALMRHYQFVIRYIDNIGNFLRKNIKKERYAYM